MAKQLPARHKPTAASRVSRVSGRLAGMNWASVRCLGRHEDRVHRMRLDSGDLLLAPICRVCGRVNRDAQVSLADVLPELMPDSPG